MAWVWSVQPEVPFHWAREITEISSWNFCGMESALVVLGLPHIPTLTIFLTIVLLI